MHAGNEVSLSATKNNTSLPKQWETQKHSFAASFPPQAPTVVNMTERQGQDFKTFGPSVRYEVHTAKSH